MTDFVTSDLHLGHEKCITEFKRPDGTRLRDFKDVEEMNEEIIGNINKTVSNLDRLFILGDCVINKKWIPKLELIECKNRILVGGNHDQHYELLVPHFKKILGCMEYSDCILTHIPVAESQFSRFKKNIHGHLHGNHQMTVGYDKRGTMMAIKDTRYVNVCVEQTNFTPVNLKELCNA